MYHKLIVVGNVGAQPTFSYATNGDAVCNFPVAVNARWRNAKTGELEEKATWFRVSCWRKLAETCSVHVVKGMRVLVEGEVSAHGYSDKNGKVQAGLEVRAAVVRFLSPKNVDSIEEATAEEYYDDVPQGNHKGK